MRKVKLQSYFYRLWNWDRKKSSNHSDITMRNCGNWYSIRRVRILTLASLPLCHPDSNWCIFSLGGWECQIDNLLCPRWNWWAFILHSTGIFYQKLKFQSSFHFLSYLFEEVFTFFSITLCFWKLGPKDPDILYTVPQRKHNVLKMF